MNGRGLVVALTSGPTREAVDEVRFVSNVSTGALGTAVASAFLDAGHRVTMLSCVGSIRPAAHPRLRIVEYESAASLLERLTSALGGEAHAALVHAAAVADYAPVRTPGKISSSEPELVLRMTQTPKIGDQIRFRFPGLPMILFKLESGIPREELWRRARATMTRAGADAIVANLTGEVSRDSHRADLLRKDGSSVEMPDRGAIARALVAEVERLAAARGVPGGRR